MKALLALGSLLRAGDEIDLKQKGKLLNQTVTYMTGAVAALRRSLASSQGEAFSQEAKNDANLCTAYYLACFDSFTGRMESARTHLRGCKSLSDERGGLKALTWPLRCEVIAIDLFVAQNSLKNPVFEVAEYDPESFWEKLTPEERETLTQDYGVGRKILDDLCSPTAEYIFAGYCELLAVHDLAGKTEDMARRTNMLLWAHLRKYALAAYVFDMRLCWATIYADSLQDDQISPAALQASLDLCACIAMRYAEQIVFNATAGIVTVYADFAELKRILSRPDICQHADAELLLWILGVASIIEEIVCKVRGLLRSRWHLLRFFALSQILGLTSVESIAKVMNKYLYAEFSMAKHIRLLLDKGSRLFEEIRSGVDPRSESDEDQDLFLDQPTNTPPKNQHLTRLLTFTLPNIGD